MTSTSRALSTSARKLLRWVGGSEAEIKAANPGERGENAVAGIKLFESRVEEKYGDKAAYLQVQGTRLHKSTKDPNETMEVVTVSVHTEKGTRLASGHAREDGTITEHESRAGKT